jgi:hypothetical protein
MGAKKVKKVKLYRYNNLGHRRAIGDSDIMAWSEKPLGNKQNGKCVFNCPRVPYNMKTDVLYEFAYGDPKYFIAKCLGRFFKDVPREVVSVAYLRTVQTFEFEDGKRIWIIRDLARNNNLTFAENARVT